METVSNFQELFQPLSEVFLIERLVRGTRFFYKAEDIEELYEEHFTLSGNETENRQFSIVIELRSVEGIGFRESIREVLQRKNIRDFFRKYTVEE